MKCFESPESPALYVRNSLGVRPIEDDGPKALIVRPASGLQRTDSGAEKVLSRVVLEALTIARGRDIANPSVRIRIGKYDLREQDYQQILIWAQEASKKSRGIGELAGEREAVRMGKSERLHN